MIEVLHNTRCSKSRAAIKYLEDKKIEFNIREYLKDPLNKSELEDILSRLNYKPSDLIRKKEAIYKELNLQNATEEELLDAMIINPKLIERPIVTNGTIAVVARPDSEIDKVI